MMSAVGPVGGGAGSAPSSVARALNSDAIFRIEVSLSSRRSTVIVMKCTARLYSLETVAPAKNPSDQGDSEWKSLAYGVPCIQITRETTEANSPFSVKIVVAEIESGITLWSCPLSRSCKYHAMQNNFHTLTAEGKPHAIQFANESEAVRFLESVEDLLFQKEKIDSDSSPKGQSEDSLFKKPKLLRKLTKKDISAPCNFKHVSGITIQRTKTCETELRGTMQRKIRSLSFSGRKKTRPQNEDSKATSSEVVEPKESSSKPGGVAAKPPSGGSSLKHSRSFRHRFGSLSRPKKKPQTTVTVSEVIAESSPATNDSPRRFMRNSEGRRSLPNRTRKQQRPAMDENMFIPFGENSTRPLSPTRRLSQSSGDLASSGHGHAQSRDQFLRSEGQPVATPSAATVATNGGSGIQEGPHPSMTERRYTDGSTSRNGNGYNYTPYSKSAQASSKKRSATLDQTASSRQFGAVPTRGPHPSMSHRQYSSDMALDRNNTDYVERRGGAGGGARPSMKARYEQRMSAYEIQSGSDDFSSDHQFSTLDRNFRMSHISQQSKPSGSAEQLGGGVSRASADEGYVHLYKPKTAQMGGRKGNNLSASSASLQARQPADPTPQNLAMKFSSTENIPSHQNHTTTGYSNGGVNLRNATTSPVHQSLVSIPEASSETQRKPLSHSTKNSQSYFSEHYNILRPPVKGSQRPVEVAVPKVPPSSSQNEMSHRVVATDRRNFKPSPQNIDRKIFEHLQMNAWESEGTSVATGKRPIHLPNGSVAPLMVNSSGSIPVQVQPPVMPRPSIKTSDSTHSHCGTPQPASQVSQMNRSDDPLPVSTINDQFNRTPSLNNSTDVGGDGTADDILPYTEQMSKALEQFSLLTKRPSFIQTSF